MAIYRLDLDALEEAREEYQLSVKKVNENIDTSYAVIKETNETIYSGEDGDNFRRKFTNFVDKDIVRLQETLSQMETALCNGLEEAKGCKKICNDFIITLGGESNGKSEADMHGEFYCDQSVIGELKDACREAVSYTEPIRTEADRVKTFLDSLQMVKLDASPYVEKIKEGCDKVEKLEEHSRELGTYAETAELIDDSFKNALNGCIPLLFLGLEIGLEAGMGSLTARVETIVKIMEQKSKLSEWDKEVLDKNLRIMEENGEIEELRKVTEHAGNGENEAWTAGDAYVMAHIYKYAENHANAELATAVYNKMKKAVYIKSYTLGGGESVEFVSRYKVMLDEDKVSAILGELDPEEDGLAYYSLQRRSKYVQKVEVPNSELSEEAAKESFEINFEMKDGRLVSLFTADSETMRLASVDMNEVVGQEWDKSPMKGMGFSEEERIGLMSSIYTDEDISFIGGLVRAGSQSDYRDLFLQHESDELGDAVLASLYQYSFALANHNITYNDKFNIAEQNFSPLQEFVNGLLETDISAASDTEVYLNNLAEQGSLQLDITAWAISNNYDNKDMVDMLIPNFELNAELYGLYACLLNRRENNVNYRFDNIGNCIQISELGFGLAGNEGIDGKHSNIVNITSSNLCFKEKVTYYDEMKVLQQAPPVSEELEREIVLSCANNRLAEKFDELKKKQKEKKKVVPKSIVKTSIAVASVYYPWIGVAAGVAESIATLESDTARSTAQDVLNNLNSQFMNNSTNIKKNITILDGAADMVISYQQADKEIKEVLDDMKAAMFEDFIIMEDSIVAEGVYSANTLLRRIELEKNGLSFMVDDPLMKEAVKEELLNPSKASQSILEKMIKEKVFDKDKVIPSLYLMWTGEPYVNESGEVSGLDNIYELPADDIKECMDQLGVIIEKMGLNGENDKINVNTFINYNFF